MKIGYINNAYYPTLLAGSERSVQVLAEAITTMGHSAAVLTFSPNEVYEEAEVNGINVTYIAHKNVYSPRQKPSNPLRRVVWHLIDSYNIWTKSDVRRWLEKEKPDLLHTNILGGISVAAWDAAREAGVPVVHTLREYYLQCRLMSLNRKGHECEGICAFCQVCAVPRKARSSVPSAVVGISRHVLDSHLNAGFFPGVPHRKVIFNSIAMKEVSNLPAPSHRLRLGFIGRIESLKGIDFLLEALESLPKDKYELYIAGEGKTPYMSKNEGRDFGMPIHWLGFVPPEKLFPLIDLLVVPSLWQEPFGRVIAEAYTHGLPVIASRVGGIPEIVDEGVTGFLFDPFTPGDFQQKLSPLTTKQLQEMRPACLKKVTEFEPATIGRQYLELYLDVLGPKRNEVLPQS